MKCYLLTAFVFVFCLTYVRGYNLPFPIAFLQPRTKYDYDLTRFFIGLKETETPDTEKDFRDSAQVYNSPIGTTGSPIHKDEQYHQNHPLHFGSSFSSFNHRSEVTNNGQSRFYKPFHIKFQHEPPKRPYFPYYEITNPQNKADKTGFGAPFSFNQNNNFQTTTARPLPSVPRVPPATHGYPAPWISPTSAPQTDSPNIFHRFGDNVQQDNTKGFGASGGFSEFASAAVDSQNNFQPSNQSPSGFQSTINRATTVPAVYKPEVTTTKPGIVNAALLTSLAKDTEVKYKETETDYYDFDEADLKRPQYDLNASRKLFAEFVQKYGKTYKDKQDEEKHYQHFVNSLMSVNRLNSEGGSASFDINFMSDEDPKVYGK